MQKLFQFLRSVVAFFLPGGLVFFLVVGLTRAALDFGWFSGIGQALIYGIPAIGLFLGWRFHRSRLATVAVLIALTERLLFYFGSESFALPNGSLPVSVLIGLFLPLNLCLLLFAKEYRLQRLPSLIGFSLVFLQVPAVVALVRKWPQFAAWLIYQPADLGFMHYAGMPLPVLIAEAAVVLLFLVRALFERTPVVCGFLWLLLTALYGLQAVETAEARMLCFVGAGLIVILTLLESVYAMAFRDELTGLPGRRALNSAFLGLSGGYAVAMLDIDFFKKFNDRYGHDVGDQVLRMVASRLGRVEGGGRAFRYGGEEFTILFAGKSKKDVLPHLEKLLRSVADSGFVLRGKDRSRRNAKKKSLRQRLAQTVSVTVSIGVADSGTGGKAADIIKAADQALYRAKKKGRNRVE